MVNLVVKTADQLANMNTEALKTHFAESLDLTAKHLTYMGMIWLELENRGEDLSDLKKGLGIYIPMIAHGRVDSNTVIQYAGQKTLLTALTHLDIKDQREVLKNNAVTVWNPDGEIEEKKALSELSVKEIVQVFSDDKIRPAEQQKEFLSLKAKRQPKKRIARKIVKVSVDKSAMVIEAGNARVDLQSVVSALKTTFTAEELRELMQ